MSGSQFTPIIKEEKKEMIFLHKENEACFKEYFLQHYFQ